MKPARGFTLIEVMVALVIMAVLSGMAWQGIDTMLRSRAVNQASVDRTLRLSSVLGQWEQDLRSIHTTNTAPDLVFDGASLRMTRRVPDGVQVVVWALRDGRLQRWASPAVTSAQTLQEHWFRSLQLLGNEPQQLQTLSDVRDMQVYFFRGNSWSNAQSSGNVTGGVGTPGTTQLPTGVRVVWTLAGDGTLKITRDVRLSPL